MASFNMDALTNKQIAEVEDVTGKAFSDLFLNGKPSWTLQCVFAWFALREEQPGLKFQDVLDSEMNIVLDVLDADDPKDETSEK